MFANCARCPLNTKYFKLIHVRELETLITNPDNNITFIPVVPRLWYDENPEKIMKFPKTGVRAMEGENATVERRNARAGGEPFGGV